MYGRKQTVMYCWMVWHCTTVLPVTLQWPCRRGAEIIFAVWPLQQERACDNNTMIDHAVPNCTSNELFKYGSTIRLSVLSDWYWYVRMHNIQIHSRLTVICATRDARMYTQPQLEIHADDVKCSWRYGRSAGCEGALSICAWYWKGGPSVDACFVNEVIDTIWSFERSFTPAGGKRFGVNWTNVDVQYASKLR